MAVLLNWPRLTLDEHIRFRRSCPLMLVHDWTVTKSALPIGKGGMGEVSLAQDTMLERAVALKVLPADVSADKNRMQRFIREAKTASALNHQNILTIHEIGQQDEHHFIATEYIEGESLRQHMTRSRMELREVLDVISQVASALSAAHQFSSSPEGRRAHTSMKLCDACLKKGRAMLA
jgi:hypothetical protein